MVLLATPNAALSRSAVTHGSLAGSDRKLTCPSAYTTPAAHVARRPACSGEGRLRASFATARRARSAYSSSRTDRHTESVMPTISSTTGRSPLGIFSSSSAITATPSPHCPPRAFVATAFRAGFLAAADRFQLLRRVRGPSAPACERRCRLRSPTQDPTSARSGLCELPLHNHPTPDGEPRYG